MKQPPHRESRGNKAGNGEGWYHQPTPQREQFFDILDTPTSIYEPAAPNGETTERWRPKLARRLRAMGEAVRVPDKQGIFIPLTFAGILLTMLVTLGGVFYRAGQIVQNQNVQEAARLEMNRQWKEDLGELKENLEAVRDMRTALGSVSDRVTTIEQSMAQFTQQSIEERATLRAEQDELRRNLVTQEREQRLLRDYTEGRISGLPYRPPSG